jgi:hypothetical protein
MNMPRFLVGLALFTTLFFGACKDDRIVAPTEELPPVLAIDRPSVQLFRFARGKQVKADTIFISNNGQGPLGGVEMVGGVDYITTTRTGWLRATIVNLGNDEALLVLEPTYAEDEQDAADIAEVVLQARGSPELKRVQVIARTLRGASFEFSVSPMAFAAVPGDPGMSQHLTVRNGGNGTLQIPPPTVHYVDTETDWLALGLLGGSTTSPSYLIQVDPGEFGGGLFQAYLVFDSPGTEETRAKPDSVLVQLNIGQPVLAVSTSTLAFTVVRGAQDPPAQSILLSNAGEGAFSALGSLAVGTVTYGVGANGWLTPVLNGSQISVSAQIGALDAGDYEASISIESNNGGGETVRVTLSVEAPDLTAASRTVSFGMVEGDAAPPASQIVGLTNTGSGTFAALGDITLGAFSPSATWMSAQVVGETVVLSPTPSSMGLGAGDYSTTLPINSMHGGSETLFVTLSVSRGLDPPKLALSATRIGFSGIAGDPSPAPQQVQTSNAGGGSLGTLSLGSTSYAGASGWLTTAMAGSAVVLTVTTGTLPDGDHIATVPVTSALGGNSAIKVTFTVGSPILTASATSTSFSAAVGGANPTGQTVTFTNTGPGTFASLGAVSAGAVAYGGVGGWLTASYAGRTLTLSVTTGALGTDTYTATVPVTSAEGGSVSISVTFTVARTTDAAVLVASPSSVRMNAVKGGSNPPGQTVLLSNSGGGILGALNVTGTSYGGGASGWLSASLAGTTLTLNATTGSLAQGTYTATVNVSSAEGGNASVSVTFQVATPTLTLSSTSASFGGEVGGAASPATASIGISNTGAGDLSNLGTISVGTITYGSGSGWLAASLAGGGSQLKLTPTLGALGAGTYKATVPVNSTAGGSGSVRVTFTVAPAADDPQISLSGSSVGFFAEEGGGNPSSQKISISNSGGGDLASLGALSLGTISYGVGTGWLSASLAGSRVTLSATTGALTAAGGPYTATVPVQSANGGNHSISVTFSISAAAGVVPNLEVSPSSVRADAVYSGSDPGNQEVKLYNAGGGSLGALSVGGITFGAGGSGWLTAARTASKVTLSYDISGLAPNTYTATVSVESADGGNENVSVTLVISGPTLTLSSGSAGFSGLEGSAASPASVSINLSNTGAGTFSTLGTITLGATTYGSTGGWLSAGLAGSDTRVDLSATIGAIGAGTYTATVPVSSVNGGNGSISIALTVTPSQSVPNLSLSATSVNFTAVLGGASPSAKAVNLSNSGGGTVADLGTLGIGTITYGGGSTGWLSGASIGGSTLTLPPATGSLAAGTHTATVPVTSQFGGNESVSISVEVGSPILTASNLDLSFTGSVGAGSPANQTVSFSNTGVGARSDLGTLTPGAITYGVGATGWLSRTMGGSTLTVSADQGALASGVYSASLPVSSQYGGSQTISVTLSVVRDTDPAVMVLSSTTQRFDALVGGSNPPSQNVVASNAGGGTLGAITVGGPSYGAGATGWLSASVSGTTITTRVRTGSLPKGTYSATLSVSSSGGSQSIDVTFIVGTSRLTLTPRTVSFSDTVAGPGSAPAMVAIANTGGGSYTNLGTISLDPTLYGEGASGWLVASLTAPDTVQVRANTGALLARSSPYQARVPVMASQGGADTITVVFTVAPGTIPPSLSLSQDSMTFAGILGATAPAAQTVVGSNSGGGELGALSIANIDYAEGAQGWLSGSVEGLMVSLQPAVDGLSGETYRATVTIASENGGSGTLEVALDLALPLLDFSSRIVTFSDTVGSPDTLQSQVFISNTGAGNRESLGSINLGSIVYPQGAAGWLITEPGEGEGVEGFQVGLKGSAAQLPEGDAMALVPVESQWGGVDTVAVTFIAREPNRSFDLPTIQLVVGTLVTGEAVLVPLPGDSVVVGPVSAGPTELGVRVGVRNGSATRVTLSGLRVGIPTYPEGQTGGWITGAFLNRTTATFDAAAELFMVVVPDGLPSGRYEGRLVISSGAAELEAVVPKVLRVILVVN